MIRHRMKLRSSRFSWASLPAEIRIMILESIAGQKHPGWASFASVCREWQYVLEAINFRKISLQVSCLDDLALLSSQRRELIHHIYFSVELPRYTYKCCSKRRSPPVNINRIVADAIWKLFCILSTWGPADNLALELNIYSPSDCEHWFKNIHLSSDNVDREGDATPTAWIGTPASDPRHGWILGQQIKAPPRFAIQRLFQCIHLDFREPLPQVKAVTRFIIRRQLRRYLPQYALSQMFKKFDRLEHISYEPWEPLDPWRGLPSRNLYCGIHSLPETLNSLIIFEDSCEFYDLFPRIAPLSSMFWFPPITPSKTVATILASKSLKLHHFAISFMVDAENILGCCRPTWIWQRLGSLALTSQLLRDEMENRAEIELLLYRAAALVPQMPKIRTFVLWNGGKGNACAFIYRIERGSASVTWRGTWLLTLTPRVVESWQLADSKLHVSRPELQFKQERIRADLKSHGDAIYHLKLPCQVIEPASLWQIRREGRILTQ